MSYWPSSPPSVAHAQLGRPTEAHDHDHEGRIFAGGALTYWRNTKERTTTFDFSPEIGYLFNDTWGTGLLLGYEHGSAGEGPARSVENAFKISPFVRCYYMHRGPFNLFMDGGAGVNFAEERKGGSVERRNGFEVGIRPGGCVDLTEGLCLCLPSVFSATAVATSPAKSQASGTTASVYASIPKS